MSGGRMPAGTAARGAPDGTSNGAAADRTASPTWPDAQHVVFVHAHPDDETLATGALMAELVDRGVTVTLVTCTRGERGEVVAGPLSHLEGTAEFAAHRETELAGALGVLGVTRHVWLGMPPARAAGSEARVYEDSGMRWVREGLAGPAEDAPANALTSMDTAGEVADLVTLLRALGNAGDASAPAPDLVVSYNEIGGYGHPDHVRAREIAHKAAQLCGIRFAEIISDRSTIDEARNAGEPAVWYDLDQRLDQVKRALAHHASQVTVSGDDVVHSGGQRTPIETSVGLRII